MNGRIFNMSPEIRRHQLKNPNRLAVQEVLEEHGVELDPMRGDIDVFYTTKDDPIIIVPAREDEDIVERVFYLEGSEDWVRPLAKEGVIFEVMPRASKRFPSDPLEKSRGRAKPLRIVQ